MKKYWSSLEEYRGIPGQADEKFDQDHKKAVIDLFEKGLEDARPSRRDFLKLFGFSLTSAAIAASCERPVIKAIPYVIHPDEIIPGKSMYYASCYFDGHEFCDILVKNRDGRPVKIEGNTLSAFSKGGTTARVQASVLSLYDEVRYKQPLSNGNPVSWEEADSKILAALKEIQQSGKEVVFLSSTLISPSTRKLIAEFGSSIPGFRWVQYDAISYSGLLEANLETFGKATIPDYRFDKADLVVSFGADFLGSWLAPVRFARLFSEGRKLSQSKPELVKLIQFESGLSLTGSNSDKRYPVKPSEEKVHLAGLYNYLVHETGTAYPLASCEISKEAEEVAKELIRSKGKSIVVSGSNSPELQILVNAINSMLGNYGSTIDFTRPIQIAAGIDQEMKSLVSDMQSGKVGAMFIYNVNPAYDYPDQPGFREGMAKLGMSVSLAVSPDETSVLCGIVCPSNHYLESWDDAGIMQGMLSLSQPCIHPVFNTRAFQDSFLTWMGSGDDYHNYLMKNWEKSYYTNDKTLDFETFWDECLRNGVFESAVASVSPHSFDGKKLSSVTAIISADKTDGFEISLYESIALGTGKHANNPWLMELPDPMSKLCWDSVAMVSVVDAEELGIKTGDVIRIGGDLEIPVLVQPGQAQGTVSLPLGYGHSKMGKVADGIGVNVYPMVNNSSSTRLYYTGGVSFTLTGNSVKLALTQTHSSMEGRPIVRETSLEAYKMNPASGNEMHEEIEKHHKTLYPDVKFDGHHWALAIDLTACTGCSTCVIACQAENNIPTVGRNEVFLRRIMHWIKIDRYYSGEPGNPEVYFQPQMCQHCDNAPCENVCPVSATNHSSEGLNQMAYNRCIGTKYCINNCPYRARRFNWYKYTDNKKDFDFNSANELGKMVLNPDVTVRDRGVVEKCSFCVQRIQEVKLQAKLENRAIRDGEIQPACVQSCPSGAMVFGDLNDKKSRIAELFRDPRNYHLLEELHTLPSVGYLTRVRNG